MLFLKNFKNDLKIFKNLQKSGLVLLCDLDLHDRSNAERLGLDLFGFFTFEQFIYRRIEMPKPNPEQCWRKVFFFINIQVDLREVFAVTACP